MFEGLRFADTSERITQRVGERLIDAPECLAVLGLLVGVVLPSVLVEGVRSTQNAAGDVLRKRDDVIEISLVIHGGLPQMFHQPSLPHLFQCGKAGRTFSSRCASRASRRSLEPKVSRNATAQWCVTGGSTLEAMNAEHYCRADQAPAETLAISIPPFAQYESVNEQKTCRI